MTPDEIEVAVSALETDIENIKLAIKLHGYLLSAVQQLLIEKGILTQNEILNRTAEIESQNHSTHELVSDFLASGGGEPPDDDDNGKVM